MLPTPSNSPRVVLAPRTNTLNTPQLKLASQSLPTPPADLKRVKRRLAIEEKPIQKRIKLDTNPMQDKLMTPTDVEVTRASRNTSFQLHTRFIASPATICRRHAPSTFPILQSFVSSNKSDVFKCHSIGEDTYLTPPYACSYSNGAKAGRTAYLAVATEQGSVHILNTSKRNDWDPEPQRTTIQPHHNGVFDVKWSLDDTSLATCSGDQSTRISCTKTGAITHVLRGHNSTVKCVAWDSSNRSLVATGGRDGAICLWDLRIGERLQGNDLIAVGPVLTIHGAHEDTIIKSKPKPRKGKQQPTPRTITSLLYPDSAPYGLVSSSSSDGILRYWDLRKPVTSKKSRSTKPVLPSEVNTSSIDPTSLHGSKRPRGIITLAQGTGPSAGLIFGIGADSRIHTYDLPTLTPRNMFSHESLQTSSFYVGLSVSPCGRWLACGGSGKKGNSFLFDVENAGRLGAAQQKGIELKGLTADVGAVDWAQDSLATCLDDGLVRVWRPDLEMHIQCLKAPKENRWDWVCST
ncbi:WD40 repeat-like protein [Pholiota conissans]|uniref:WD40 repeat-like protein n=1 Tax=Pholiota conissans TaxID=109636 RepID=A0A9P5ZDG6_9AGAR|nr:WD40 repeat-like protein [Pholiota conissans]